MDNNINNDNTNSVEETVSKVDVQDKNQEFISPLKKNINKVSNKVANNSKDNTNNSNNNQIKNDVEPLNLNLKEEVLTYIKPEDLEKLKKEKIDENLLVKYIYTYNDMQKYNKLQNERLNKIKEYEALLGEDGQKFKNFIEIFREDPVSALTRYAEDFNLPDIDSLMQHINRTKDVFGQIELYQKKELIPKIEKKYGLEEGTFIYDPSEAYTPNTASYEYRVMTEKKEAELKNSLIEQEKALKQLSDKLAEERRSQLKLLKDTYFPDIDIPSNASEEEINNYKKINADNEAKFVEMLNALDESFAKMKELQTFDHKVNPLSIVNVFRGFHFDRLVKEIVDREVDKIHKMYNSKGLYLMDESSKPLPKDVTKVQGKPPSVSNNVYQSPLKRLINRTVS